MKNSITRWFQRESSSRDPESGFQDRIKRMLSSMSRKNRRKAEAQRLFNLLATRQFDGWSFTHSMTCIAMQPSQEEIYQCFIDLQNEVRDFFHVITDKYRNLHEISPEELAFSSRVFAAKVMTTLYDDLYFVSAVILFKKNADGTWQTVTDECRSDGSFFTERRRTNIIENYPRSITISFCGSFGDVNYVEQKEFKYNCDLFFAY